MQINDTKIIKMVQNKPLREHICKIVLHVKNIKKVTKEIVEINNEIKSIKNKYNKVL